MKIGIHLSDYRVHSQKIFRGAIFSFAAILFAILLAEVIVDLNSTSLAILLPLNAASFLLLLVYLRFPKSTWLRLAVIVMIYVVVESHFFHNPQTFHVISYWMPIVPIGALIVAGIRTSQIWAVIVLLTHFFNAMYVQKYLGGKYVVVVNSFPFFVSGFIFTVSILAGFFLLYTLLGDAYNEMKSKNEELDSLKQQIEEKKNLLQHYQHELVHISKNELLQSNSQSHLFSAICRSASKALPVSRVSIWFLSDDSQTLVRGFLVENTSETDLAAVLKRAQFPNYFQALDSKPYILATHAAEHPDTAEFASDYLPQLGIYSMLDCPIIVDQKTIGVICCENQQRTKYFTEEDTLFIQSLADFISLSYKNERIKKLLEEVSSKNNLLLDRNSEIKHINEELASLNETLTDTNNNLESTVARRTSELEKQNKRLTEYAFINSHLLRAPLSRIMGLAQLIVHEVTSTNEKELLDALLHSTNEMDTIIRKISEVLYDGNNLTRDDIQAIVNRNFEKKD